MRAGAGERRARAVPSLASALAAGVCLALAWTVYRRALDAFFAPDDFVLLARARGLTPGLTTPWRWLSGTAYWTTASRLFGAAPFPYHLVVWLLHGIDTVLLFAVARRLGASRSVAMLAAGVFGTSRLAFTAVYPASSVGEVLALGFTLLSVLLIGSRNAVAADASAGAFALALLSKESITLLPFATLLRPAGAGIAWRRWGTLAALGILWGAVLVVSGATRTALGGTAYARAFGLHIVTHLLRYTGAVIDPRPVVVDPAAPGGAVPGAAALALMTIAAIAVWRRTRLPAIGLAGWILGLAPVLPLLHAQHAHYAYAPFAFLALGLAALVLLPFEGGAATAASRAPRRRWAAPALAGVLLLAHAVHAESAITRRHAAWIASLDLPLDTALRKMVFARNAIEDLRRAVGDRPARIAWMLPPASGQVISATTGRAVRDGRLAGERYDFLFVALDSGRAVRVLLPQVEELRMTEHWTPDLARHLLVTNWVNGHVEVHGYGLAAELSLARSWASAGLRPQAIAYLEEVVAGGAGEDTLRGLLAELRRDARVAPGPGAP